MIATHPWCGCNGLGIGHCFLCHRLWVKYPNVSNAILTRDTIIEFITTRSMSDGIEPSEHRLMHVDWIAVIGPCLDRPRWAVDHGSIWGGVVEKNSPDARPARLTVAAIAPK